MKLRKTGVLLSLLLAACASKQSLLTLAGTIVPARGVGRRIHGEGERGGLWNNAWRQFRRENPRALPDAIYRQAGKMIYEFELAGPVVPYYSGRRG
ncbi:DUF2380 domain-containing protein [Hyalangium gracile]|uniref:DUF2380 domain-containing protein n=1 Tax=Hyalangium gracile TaxID=394092 RepID=UPI001CCE8ECA|nr:DUF2380 domain-containing protein [Hyalangium gracile]